MLYMITWPCLYIVCGCLHAHFIDFLKYKITTVLSRVDWLNRYLLKLVVVIMAPFVAIVYLTFVAHSQRAFENNRWAQIGAVLFYMHVFLVYIVGPYILQPIYQTIDKWRHRIQVTKDMYISARAFISNEFTDYVDARCNICVVNRKDVVLIPCGHTVCHVCVDKINICPQCRRDIHTTQVMYIN